MQHCGGSGSEMDKFDFSLAYYDPVLKWPFMSFKPKATP
jgi:hypothetical protein